MNFRALAIGLLATIACGCLEERVVADPAPPDCSSGHAPCEPGLSCVPGDGDRYTCVQTESESPMEDGAQAMPSRDACATAKAHLATGLIAEPLTLAEACSPFVLPPQGVLVDVDGVRGMFFLGADSGVSVRVTVWDPATLYSMVIWTCLGSEIQVPHVGRTHVLEPSESVLQGLMLHRHPSNHAELPAFQN